MAVFSKEVLALFVLSAIGAMAQTLAPSESAYPTFSPTGPPTSSPTSGPTGSPTDSPTPSPTLSMYPSESPTVLETTFTASYLITLDTDLEPSVVASSLEAALVDAAGGQNPIDVDVVCARRENGQDFSYVCAADLEIPVSDVDDVCSNDLEPQFATASVIFFEAQCPNSPSSKSSKSSKSGSTKGSKKSKVSKKSKKSKKSKISKKSEKSTRSKSEKSIGQAVKKMKSNKTRIGGELTRKYQRPPRTVPETSN